MGKQPAPRISKSFCWILAGILGLTLGGCGDGSGQKSAAPETTGNSGTASAVVTESDHEKFEKLYIEKCVKSQQNNPESQIKSDQELGSLCECVAKEVSKRLSKPEVVHFLKKKEVPIDLVMMGNAAENICLSAKK